MASHIKNLFSACIHCHAFFNIIAKWLPMDVGCLASNSDHKPFGYPGVEGQEKRIE